MDFSKLAEADVIKLVLILLIAFVASALPGYIALYRDVVRNRAAKEERIDKSEEKREDDSSQMMKQMLSAIAGLAASFDARTTLETAVQRAHEAEAISWQSRFDQLVTQLREKDVQAAKVQADYIETARVRTEQINKQFSHIEIIQDNQKKLDEVKGQLAELPRSIEKQLQPTLEDIRSRLAKLEADLAASNIKLEAELNGLKSDVSRALAMVSPPAPDRLPEITTKLDMTATSDDAATMLGKSANLPNAHLGGHDPLATTLSPTHPVTPPFTPPPREGDDNAPGKPVQ